MLGSARQSSVSGIAKPEALVRVFRKTTEGGGEIAGFLGEAVADPSGNWTASVPMVPVGTFVAATPTLDGGTLELSAATTALADPLPPVCMCVPPQDPPPTPDTTKPKLTIEKAPKPKSTATRAKFKFVSNEAGSTFKCKLDSKAFANCMSPKTYKNLKLGKHTFKVKATDQAGNVSAVLTRKFTVLE